MVRIFSGGFDICEAAGATFCRRCHFYPVRIQDRGPQDFFTASIGFYRDPRAIAGAVVDSELVSVREGQYFRGKRVGAHGLGSCSLFQ
ncbi:hypothetical protein D3C86_1148570 [compost metagenome]